MANPTTIVSSAVTPITEEKIYWPLPTLAAGVSDSFFTNEMVGMRNDGNAFHFDDSAPNIFLGTWTGPTLKYTSDQPTPILALARRPRFYSMPLNSGNATIPGSIGSPAFATNSGQVQLTTGGLTNNNLAGMVIDLMSGKPEDVSAANVLISPPLFGALLGLYVQGFAGQDATASATAGTNAIALTIQAGRGGNTTGAGASAGGNGAGLTLAMGAGGNAAAGTGNGGAGGNFNVTFPAAATSAGGTAGVPGEFQINSASGWIPVQWQQAQGAAPSAGSFSIFLASRAMRVKFCSVIFSTTSTSGTATITKDTGTQAPGAGTALLTGTMSLSGTANNLVTGTLIATVATLTLAAGDRIAVTLAGTLTGLAGAIITVGLVPA